MFSDNAEADILGANLYRRYLSGVPVPEPRNLPSDAPLLPQTVNRIESILVSTGVHSSNVVSSRLHDRETVGDLQSAGQGHRESDGDLQTVGQGHRETVDDLQTSCQGHCHRDFPDVTPDLFVPSLLVSGIKEAVEYILQQQQQSDRL